MEYDKQKIKQMHKAQELKFFIVSLFVKGFQMRNSSFNRKHRTNYQEINGNSINLKQEPYDIEEDKRFEERIKKIARQLHIKNDDDPRWYENKLFKLFVDKGVCQLARETGIPRNSVSRTTIKVKKRIQDEI